MNSFQFPYHVPVLVHHRVPARDAPHAFGEDPPSRIAPAFSTTIAVSMMLSRRTGYANRQAMPFRSLTGSH
ncbi:MAG: hypothetical protein ACJ8AI_03690 [Rhodopila sp.]